MSHSTASHAMPMNTVEQAVADIAAGKLIIVADDEDRENEGDLICAAQLITPELVNFMIKRAGGLICVAAPAPQQRLAQPSVDVITAESQCLARKLARGPFRASHLLRCRS